MEIPQWYTANEVYEFVNRKGFEISKANAEWLANEFQKAFEKGWEKSVNAKQPA